MIATIKRWFTGYTPETPLQREQRRNVSLHFELAAANKRAAEAEARLSRIAAMETPRCAWIGKRMAKEARG